MSNSSSPTISRKGLLFVLSSPSGAGKTTLSRLLLSEEPNLTMSVSTTTRPARPGEVDGVDYHFSDTPTFLSMREQGAFLESAEVFDNYYGTPLGPVQEAIREGRDILFDIDWQGTKQICDAVPDDVVSIFILPPSGKVLEERLRTRAQDSDEVVRRRMAGASNEIKHWDLYDYVIVNVDVQESLAALKSILSAERLKRTRRTGLSDFVQSIQAEL